MFEREVSRQQFLFQLRWFEQTSLSFERSLLSIQSMFHTTRIIRVFEIKYSQLIMRGFEKHYNPTLWWLCPEGKNKKVTVICMSQLIPWENTQSISHYCLQIEYLKGNNWYQSVHHFTTWCHRHFSYFILHTRPSICSILLLNTIFLKKKLKQWLRGYNRGAFRTRFCYTRFEIPMNRSSQRYLWLSISNCLQSICTVFYPTHI